MNTAALLVASHCGFPIYSSVWREFQNVSQKVTQLSTGWGHRMSLKKWNNAVQPIQPILHFLCDILCPHTVYHYPITSTNDLRKQNVNRLLSDNNIYERENVGRPRRPHGFVNDGWRISIKLPRTSSLAFIPSNVNLKRESWARRLLASDRVRLQEYQIHKFTNVLLKKNAVQ